MAEFEKRSMFTKALTYAAVGLVLGAATGVVVYKLLMAAPAEDEDRPPIIVRGGSLIFQSGEGTTSGRPWFSDAADVWKQYQPDGVPVRVYDLTFVPTTCSARTVPEFTVFYDPDDAGSQPERALKVARLPRAPGNSGSDGPAVTGATFVPDNTISHPTLTFAAASTKIVRVEGPGGQTLCSNPTEVRAVPKR